MVDQSIWRTWAIAVNEFGERIRLTKDVAIFDARLYSSVAGTVLLFISLSGVYMLYCATTVRETDMIVAMVISGLIITLGFLMSGLYMLTYRICIKLDHRSISFESRWYFQRKQVRRMLGDYAGLTRGPAEKPVKAVWLAAAGCLLGTLGLAVATTIAILQAATSGFSKKKRKGFVLILKHSHDRKADILLATHPDEKSILDLMNQLARQFSLNVLDASLHGDTVRSPQEAGVSLIDRVAAGHLQADEARQAPQVSQTSQAGQSAQMQQQAAQLPQPGQTSQTISPESVPKGVEIETSNTGGLTIYVPGDKTNAHAGFIFGGFVVFLSIAGGVLFLDELATIGEWIVAIVFFCIGVAVIAISGFLYRGSWKVDIDDQGLGVEAWNDITEPQQIPWPQIQNVTLGRSTVTKDKPALLVSTSQSDIWILPGVNKPRLVWVRQTILDQAALRAGKRRG